MPGYKTSYPSTKLCTPVKNFIPRSGANPTNTVVVIGLAPSLTHKKSKQTIVVFEKTAM
jgi:hypothetical protein